MKKIISIITALVLFFGIYTGSFENFNAQASEIESPTAEGVYYYNGFSENFDGLTQKSNVVMEVSGGNLIAAVNTTATSQQSATFDFITNYSNSSADRNPLVLEYRVKLEPKVKGDRFITGKSGNTHGAFIWAYEKYMYFSGDDTTKYEFAASTNMTEWHTASIVYSPTENTRDFYWDGTKVGTSNEASTVAKSNHWDDGEFKGVQFIWYSKNGSKVYMDYLKVYEVPETFDVEILDADNTEFDEFTLDFNSTVGNLSTTNITFGGKTPKTIELIDEENQVYKVTLSEKLEPSTEYKLNLNNVSNMVGQSVTSEISFKTREATQLCYNIEPVSGENIVTGENKFNVTYINETENDAIHDLVVAQFDENNIMINSEKIPVKMEALTDTSAEVKVTLSQAVNSIQMYIMSTDGKTNYSGAYFFDREGEPSKEELIALPSDLEPSYSYKVLDATDEMSIEIENENDGTANIILTDKNSKVVYMGQHNTSDKKANFVFRLKESGTYTLFYKMYGNTKWYQDSIKYYSADYVAQKFEEFNTTDDITVIAGYIAEFEEMLGLDSEKLNLMTESEDKNLIYTSLLSQRNELSDKKFADSNAVNDALETAYQMFDLYKGNKKASEVAKDMANAKFYNFMDKNYSDDLIKYIDTQFNGKMYNSDSLFDKAFCDSVVLSGVYKGENYSLTTKIISDLASEIPLDLTTYSRLSNPSNVDINLSGKSYANISLFIAAFNSGVQNQYNIENPVIILPPPTPGISFSGGGGGGSKPSEEITPPQEVIPPQVIKPQEKFTDLSGFDWAKDAINNLANKGIVNGVSEESYNPGGSVKREEFIKMIDTLYSAENTIPSFTDVNQNEWYAPFVNKAVSAGIIKGMSENTFGLGQGVTREDMAVMIVRALKLENITTEETFLDDLSIADYAKEAVYTLKNKGIISGTGNGNYEPKRVMTRAEAAVLINNILNIVD